MQIRKLILVMVVSIFVSLQLISTAQAATKPSKAEVNNMMRVVQIQLNGKAVGSGSFVSENTVITAYHVVGKLVDWYSNDADKLEVVTYSGERSKFEIVDIDTTTDIAIITTKFKKTYPVAKLAEKNPMKGEYVIYGNSTSDNWQRVTGEYIGLGTTPTDKFHKLTVKWMEVDVYSIKAKPGYSGSAILDAQGNLYGVLVMSVGMNEKLQISKNSGATSLESVKDFVTNYMEVCHEQSRQCNCNN